MPAVGDIELPRLKRLSSAPPCVLHDRRFSGALHCHPFHVRAWLNRRLGDGPYREGIQYWPEIPDRLANERT